MILNELWRHYPGKISEFLWIQDEGKSNEGRERGGGGKKRKWKNILTIQSIWSPHFQLKSLRGDEFFEFYRSIHLEFRPYKWNNTRTSLYRQNTCEKNCVFPTQKYETFGLLGPLAFISFFRVSGSSVSSLGTTKQINQHKDILYRKKLCYFTNKILLTDWEESHVSDAKVPTFWFARSTRSQSFLWVFLEFLVGNKSSWKGPYHECYDINAGSGGGDREAARPQSKKCGGGGAKRVLPPPPQKKKKRRRGRKKNI